VARRAGSFVRFPSFYMEPDKTQIIVDGRLPFHPAPVRRPAEPPPPGSDRASSAIIALTVQLSPLDWSVVALYFLFNLSVGLYYRNRAKSSVDEFFLSGRDAPWWLAGTSMVATTFAADTPLAITGMVATGGIAGNWLWWSFAAGGMLTVFFYARLWRRSGVMTDIEFAEIRYSGPPAAFLRGFRALYLGIPINCIILGWVNKAMVDILTLVLGVTERQALAMVLGIIALTSFISALSGLWGVLVTDLFQFVIKMGMAIVLAVFAVRAVGGLEGMKQKLAAVDAARGAQGSALNFVPDLNSAWMPLIAFLVYISLNWWATWYPGAEPGGGGYVAQRMLSARDERHSLLATLWFNVAHYALRPWPWILVALASLILFPGLANPETGYLRVMILTLPPSLRGLMVAAFAAAYMSTIATQLNWGASYLVNDFYRRFLRPAADRRHYILVSRLATVFLTLVSVVVTSYLDSISGAWKLLLVTGAGTGGVLLLRWYWWRINAWSEISAMIAAFLVSITLQLGFKLDSDKPVDFAWLMIITVGISTAVWLAVTFLTAPESKEVLLKFYRRTRPSPAGWAPIARLAPEVKPARDGLSNLLDWAAGCALIYGVLFGTGKLLLHQIGPAVALLALGGAGLSVIYWDLSRRGWRVAE
jgi:solute:Na+ symporter, SSS family